MNLIKRGVFIFLVLIVILCNYTYANYAMFDVNELKITIKNITDKIYKIQLLQYGQEVNFKEVYGENFDYDNFKMNEEFNTAYLDTIVDPFKKEDYIKNHNYNKDKYIVIIEYRYAYKFSKKSKYIEYEFSSKFNNINELKKSIKNEEYSSCLRNISNKSSIEKLISESNLSCRRTISYSILKLNALKNISIYEIKDNKLDFSIKDFKSLEDIAKIHSEHGNGGYGYAVRFFCDGGICKTIICGNNIIMQDSYDKTRPTIKNVEFDYQTQGIIYNTSNESNIIQIIIKVLIAILITLTIELIVAIIMKIKSYKIITITNIITQLMLHVLTLLGCAILFEIPLYIYLILEIAIVFAEYKIYSIKIKEYSQRYLLLYAVLANICSFGLSLLLRFVV